MTESDFEELLATWEGNYKKGLLTFWLLLILHEREAYAFEMSTLIAGLSRETIVADDNSIYRALKRFLRKSITKSWTIPSIQLIAVQKTVMPPCSVNYTDSVCSFYLLLLFSRAGY